MSGALGLARRLRRQSFIGATVLLYHHVIADDSAADHYARIMGDPTARELDGLIAYLKRSFRFSTPSECLDRWNRGEELDPFTLILTFDDGYADLHDHMLPVLRKNRVPATVFVTTGPIAGEIAWFQRLIAGITRCKLERTAPFLRESELPIRTPAERVSAIECYSRAQPTLSADAWDERIQELADRLGWDGQLGDERMMDWRQVEALRDSGWVEIGGHTLTHPLLPNCTPDRVRRELTGCARELKDRLGLKFLAFAYPNGRTTPRVEELVREAGFACAFTGSAGLNTRSTPTFQLGRRHVPPADVANASLALSGVR